MIGDDDPQLGKKATKVAQSQSQQDFEIGTVEPVYWGCWWSATGSKEWQIFKTQTKKEALIVNQAMCWLVRVRKNSKKL